MELMSQPPEGEPAPTGWPSPADASWSSPSAEAPPVAPLLSKGLGAEPLPVAHKPWTPPVLQPGVIPLRPLGIGELFDGAIRAIRFNPQVMFGLSAMVVAVSVTATTFISVYAANLIGPGLVGEAGDLFGADSGSMTTLSITQYGMILIIVFVAPLLTGLLIVSVSKAVIGQKVSMGEVMGSRRVWWVLGFTLLMGAAALLVMGAVVALVVWLAALSLVPPAVALAVVAALAIIVVASWITVRTLLVTPALMLEGGQFWPTVTRAWRLTRGSFWRLLGVYVLMQVIVQLALKILAAPGMLVSATLAEINITVSLVANAVTSTLVYTVVTAFFASFVALLYVDVRMRREGLDLELSRSAA
jgi:hypothetical protein